MASVDEKARVIHIKLAYYSPGPVGKTTKGAPGAAPHTRTA